MGRLRRCSFVLAAIVVCVGYAYARPNRGSGDSSHCPGRPYRPKPDVPDLAPTLEGRDVLVYWDPTRSDGREKRNVMSILEAAGAGVSQTSTKDPQALKGQLAGKNAIIIAELFDDRDPSCRQARELESRFKAFEPVLRDFVAAANAVIVCEGGSATRAGEAVIDGLGWTRIRCVNGSSRDVRLSLEDRADPMVAGLNSLSTDGGWIRFRSCDPALHEVASYHGKSVLASKEIDGGYFAIVGMDYWSTNTAAASVLANAAAVPEPASLTLLVLAAMVAFRRRR